MSSYNLELYKALIEESAKYRESAAGLWLQKFTLLGGTIAFILVSHGDLLSRHSAFSHQLTALAVIAIPVISVIIDLKVLEHGFHVRTISSFIARSFPPDESLAADWEKVLWQGNPGQSYARTRTQIDILVNAAPTVLTILLASSVSFRVLGAEPLFAAGLAIVMAVTYVGLARRECRRLLLQIEAGLEAEDKTDRGAHR